MSETNQTTGGSNRLTLRKWHVVALTAGTAAAMLLVAALEIRAWRQLRNLQAAFDTFRPEIFYVGNELHASVARMNGSLLRFQLSGENEERETFQKRARAMQEKLAKAGPLLRTPAERELASRAQTLFDEYLGAIAPLLDKGVVAVRRDSATRIQAQLDQASAQLLEVGRELADAQRISLDNYVASSLQSTIAVRRSLEISAILLFVLIAGIAALIYRLMVAPLRARLSQSEAAIQGQERLASLGTLATGIAHEIRNPLTAIKFRLFSLKKSLPQAAAPNEDIEIIGSEINRLERMVKGFLEFARPAQPALMNVPVDKLFHDVRELLKPQLEKDQIVLKTESSDGVRCHVDKQQIEQVLINLVQNAAESIHRNGTITLAARYGVSKLNARSMPAVIIEVSDTGTGIPRDAEARIFDPFFSTKETGTGLGLPIAARIIEMHGGFIQYQTQPGRGTTFSIVLPRTSDNGSPNTPR